MLKFGFPFWTIANPASFAFDGLEQHNCHSLPVFTSMEYHGVKLASVNKSSAGKTGAGHPVTTGVCGFSDLL